MSNYTSKRISYKNGIYERKKSEGDIGAKGK
jgi:hypothetical protein